MPPRWTLRHPRARHTMLGIIPAFLDDGDPRSAREQFDANYRHGGGWRPVAGMQINADGRILNSSAHPNDPVYPLIGETRLRDEVIRVYLGSWVAVIQPDGSYEVARLD